MRAARQHHVPRPHPALWRIDAFAHARGIHRQRRRILEDAGAGLLRRRGEPERVIARVDPERARQMHRLKITLATQHLANLLGRPGVEPRAEIDPHHGDMPQQLVLGISSQHDQPAVGRGYARHARLADGGADIFDAVGRQCP